MKKNKKGNLKNFSRPVQEKAIANSVFNLCKANLELLVSHHSNSNLCKIKKTVINFPPLEHVAVACNSIFSNIDRSDEIQRLVARDAWILKTSLTLTALQFNDPRLNLYELINKLKAASETVASIRPAVLDLVDVIKQLEYENLNPKRNHLLELFEYEKISNKKIALMANICGTPTPGWPTTITPESDFDYSNLELIRLRRHVKNSVFDKLIILGNPCYAPRGFLLDLLYGGRTSEVEVVSYKSERVSIPAPIELPRNGYFSTRPSLIEEVPETIDLDYSGQIDKWAHDSFWSAIHAQHSEIAAASDKVDTVNAQFVLFADGSGTFLPADGRVVEVSSLFDESSIANFIGDKLPRANVRDIEEGDLVLLRLSGSGDYLEEVADSLISKAGETGLREIAVQWKSRLHNVIRRHGEGVVAVGMRKLGVKLRSPQYLWEWAGEEVMAPHDKQIFSHLIQVIWQLEGLNNGDESSAYANSRWDEMERLKTFHHKAGAVIRAALLSRVHQLASERRRIDTTESIELPGVSAGRMGLLRVAAIDTTHRQVRSSTLFQLSKLKVSSWHG